MRAGSISFVSQSWARNDSGDPTPHRVAIPFGAARMFAPHIFPAHCVWASERSARTDGDTVRAPGEVHPAPTTERATKMRTREVTKDQLVEEFKTVVAEAEQLLRSVATAGGEKADGFRDGVTQRLVNAGERLRDLRHAASTKTGAAAHATDRYVHQHPWQAIGIAAAVAAATVLAISLLKRRD